LKGHAKNITRDGPIYVPLQGRLRQHRSFQTASPIDMIKETALRFPNIPILAGLHPDEDYSASDHHALDALCAQHPNLNVTTGNMNEALASCRLVVSQNSSAALFGYFFKKPAVLFGKIDFHHIAANVHELGVDAAFDRAQDMAPNYDQYLYWFTMNNAIQADAKNAEDQIISVLKRRGWQVE
jgi:hypothetical protein